VFNIRYSIPLLLAALLSLPAHAKRQPPPAPISLHVGDSIFTTSDTECGIVYQHEKSTGALIKDIRFYRINYDPKLERDVQDIWITAFFHFDDVFWARDEDGRLYKMPLKTLKLAPITDMTQAQFEALLQKASH
jgi:hypothetical protein